ncbi:hypothetical protein H0A36_26955 [Endozoicomonas sp. SM1973]|uniref:Uncharacterized protein n=1 Tax=Spartinivicinus marinus TaxID=2994442 RepID=A0A853IGJ2_9GAMM|nr:hypothetical protein [Spartinivicinus marinus]MCX4030518.1 hypothetical protein [Spartinivicinus marinus]NYZ69658.1 hypothetical protein [Spartinivicinus marinus]
MSEAGYEALFWLLLFVHVVLAVMLSIELTEIIILSQSKKILWYCLVWFFPVAGSLIAHRAFKVGIAKGNGLQGHIGTTPPNDGF